MRKIVSILLACALVMPATRQRAAAQEVAPKSEAALQMLREDPNRAGVNVHIYEFQPEKDTPAPKGYKPVYLAHYSRHGARNDGKAENYRQLIATLEKADSAGILNDGGKYLLEKARAVLEENKGVSGHLTLRGQYEQTEIGRRLYTRYTPIFKKGCKYVRVESTTVPRTLVSMICCVNELSRRQKDLRFTLESGEKYMKLLNNTCSKEHKAASQKLLDSLRLQAVSDNETIYSTLFTDPAKARTLIPDAEKFQKNIFYTARVSESAGVARDLWKFLPEDVIYRWWDWFNRELYIRQSNSIEFGDERMTRTESLVREIVTHADEALATGSPAADLYYGHDYPVMALAGYFALEGPGDRMTFDEIPYKFCNPRWVMLAMNMQWVFYKNKAGDVLCKIVYNGEEMKIRGLAPVSGPYYRWENVKEFIKR